MNKERWWDDPNILDYLTHCDWWDDPAVVDFLTAESLLLRRHLPQDQTALLRRCYKLLPDEWQKFHRLTVAVWLCGGNTEQVHQLGFELPIASEVMPMLTSDFVPRWLDALRLYMNSTKLEPLINLANEMSFKFVTPIPRQVLIEVYRLQGHWENAWQTPTLHCPASEDIPASEWTGQDLAGRSILLDFRIHPRKIRNCGWGDIINFVWLSKFLYQLGASEVGLLCDREIEPVLKTFNCPISFNPPDVDHNLFDFVSGSYSNLLTFSKWTPDSFYPPKNYLSSPLPGQPKPVDQFRVCLCWATGERSAEQTWQGLKMPARNRSLPFTWIEKFLLPIPNVEWISLQADLSYLDAIPHKGKIKNLKPQLKNWFVTASWISSCDLVISVDTAVAHLSGAMGVRTAILLQKTPDWRWQLGTDQSMFYPSVRLFRQTVNNDWELPIKQVAAWVTDLKQAATA